MDTEAFKKRVVKVLERQISRSYIHNLPYREKSIGANSAELNQIMAEFKIEINWELLKMARAFESVDQNISVLNPDFNFTREMQRYQERARHRKKALQLQQLPNIIDQIADFSQIILPGVMQRSMTFGGSVGKGIQIATAIFGIIRKGLIIGFIALIWAYFYQHHNHVVDELHNDEADVLTNVGVTGLLERLPTFDREVWYIKAAVLLLFIYQMKRFMNKLLKPDQRLNFQRKPVSRHDVT